MRSAIGLAASGEDKRDVFEEGDLRELCTLGSPESFYEPKLTLPKEVLGLCVRKEVIG